MPCSECEGRVRVGDVFCTHCGSEVSAGTRSALEARLAELEEYADEHEFRKKGTLGSEASMISLALAGLLLLGAGHLAQGWIDFKAAGDAADRMLHDLSDWQPDDLVRVSTGAEHTVAYLRQQALSAAPRVGAFHGSLAVTLFLLYVWGRRFPLTTLTAGLVLYIGAHATNWALLSQPLVSGFGILLLFAGARAALGIKQQVEGAAPGPQTPEAPLEDAVACINCTRENRSRALFCRSCGERLTRRGPVSAVKSQVARGEPARTPQPSEVSVAGQPRAVISAAWLVLAMVGVAVVYTQVLSPMTAGRRIVLEFLYPLVLGGWLFFRGSFAAPTLRQTEGRLRGSQLLDLGLLFCVVFASNWIGDKLAQPGLYASLISYGSTTASAWVIALLVRPLMAEIIFRGYVFERLSRATNPVGANLAQAAMYAAFMSDQPMLLAFFSGLLLGKLRYQTGRLSVAVVAHVLVAAAALYWA